VGLRDRDYRRQILPVDTEKITLSIGAFSMSPVVLSHSAAGLHFPCFFATEGPVEAFLVAVEFQAGSDFSKLTR